MVSTAEYAESAEGASVVGIGGGGGGGGAVAHACGFVKCLNCDWGIENSLHWVLDMAFHDDRSRVRTGNADQNLAVVRHMAVNMLKQETTAKVGIKAKRKKAGWDYEYLILSLKVCAGRIRTNVPTPGYNIQSLFRILPQHTVALRCAKSLELPQNGFLRGNQYLLKVLST